ncbi:MAG: PH domain-containing protein [Bacilli bacterium]|nr:PH domain-containing protein [Bacilli bacterium]
MSKYDKIYNYEIESRNPLVDGEILIWSSKPKKSAYIINQILTMMPFALIWLAFDSTFIIAAFSSGEIKEMLFFLIPFFALHLMPVWIWLGQVVTANRKWKNTKYYVTDKRIIIENGFVAENYQTIYYKDIKNIYMRRGIIDQMLNVGDIHFDLGLYSNLGNGKNKVQTVFLDVENPNEVYSKLQKIVLDIQTDIEYPNALRPEENPGYNTKYNNEIK